jgi:hypothetical protein
MGQTAARNAAETYCADAACSPGTVQLSTWQVQYPNRQARSVGQSAIIRKGVGANVRGERDIYRRLYAWSSVCGRGKTGVSSDTCQASDNCLAAVAMWSSRPRRASECLRERAPTPDVTCLVFDLVLGGPSARVSSRANGDESSARAVLANTCEGMPGI